MRDDAVGREFNDAWREVKAQFEAVMVTVLRQIGLELTVETSHAAAILMGTYDTALREALIERRPLDLDLLRVTVPLVMLSVTRPVD